MKNHLLNKSLCKLNKNKTGTSRDDTVDLIHDYVEEIAKKARDNELPLSSYEITKGLNKDPKDYPDQASQPHLVVALQMRKRGMCVNVGDHIPYVICEAVATEEGEARSNSYFVWFFFLLLLI